MGTSELWMSRDALAVRHVFGLVRTNRAGPYGILIRNMLRNVTSAPMPLFGINRGVQRGSRLVWRCVLSMRFNFQKGYQNKREIGVTTSI